MSDELSRKEFLHVIQGQGIAMHAVLSGHDAAQRARAAAHAEEVRRLREAARDADEALSWIKFEDGVPIEWPEPAVIATRRARLAAALAYELSPPAASLTPDIPGAQMRLSSAEYPTEYPNFTFALAAAEKGGEK